MRTGDAIRMRSFALAEVLRDAMRERLAVAGREPGADARAVTVSGRGCTSPEPSTVPVSQSCSKSRVYAYAISGETTVAMTFSCRVHESSVQFVEPVHTAWRSRTTNLWCMRSGSPATARVGMGRRSIASGAVSGGGGTAIGPGCATL